MRSLRGESSTCLRIGYVGEVPSDEGAARWLSPRDLAQLVRIGLDHPDIRYEVLYGISGNAGAFWDQARTRELGYQPQDGAEGEGFRLGDDALAGGDFVTSEGSSHQHRFQPRWRRALRRLKRVLTS